MNTLLTAAAQMHSYIDKMATRQARTHHRFQSAMDEWKEALLEAAVQEIVKLHEASSHAEEMDSGFDGGEFSGPAHAEMLEEQVRKLCSDLRLSYEEVMGAFQEFCHREQNPEENP